MYYVKCKGCSKYFVSPIQAPPQTVGENTFQCPHCKSTDTYSGEDLLDETRGESTLAPRRSPSTT